MMRERESGQILAGVLMILIIMMTLVPLMVFFTQREAKWTEKQAQSTTAFHLAEAGIEKGFRVVSLSTATWYNLVENATLIADFQHDKEFADVPGGVYKVGISSGPEEYQATIISIGKVQKGANSEVRAIKAVFGQFSDDIAIQSMNGIDLGGGVDVEWGAVVSKKAITADGRTYPQFKSAASIDFDTDGPGGLNCDAPECCQWYSYSQDIPDDPGILLGSYKVEAEASTCTDGAPTTGCYYSGNHSWKSFKYNGGGTVYVDGNLTLTQSIQIDGSLIVIGDMSVPNGTWGDGDPDMIMPEEAWKQYCNNYGHYAIFGDAGAPPTWPGLSHGYRSPALHNYVPTQAKTAVNGLLYIGGNLNGSGGGGGNTRIYGTVFVIGDVTLSGSSSITIYYDKSASQALKLSKLNLKRLQWQSMVLNYP